MNYVSNLNELNILNKEKDILQSKINSLEEILKKYSFFKTT